MSRTDVPEEFVAEVLADAGCELDPEWVDAFRAVPRSVFVPRFFAQNTELAWELVERPSPRWAERVWRNVPLITQLDGDDALADRAATEPLRGGNGTSSSSQPSLMALMLQALEVHPGQRVLEVGTGSGYNTALLCHRLGDRSVTSVDIDGDVTARARDRLATLGMCCRIVTGDGLAGRPDDAPFDRIIATVGIARLPSSWLTRTRPGGKILFPLDLRGQGGLLPLLTVHDDQASGHFLPSYGGFMPVRAAGPHRDAAGAALREVGDAEGAESATDVPHDLVSGHSPAEFFLALRTGGYDQIGFTPSDGGPAETWFADGHGSWAQHWTEPDGNHRVRQGGTRRLWDEIEQADQEWHGLGRPPRERFGLTVNPGGTHDIWLDTPDTPAWTL